MPLTVSIVIVSRHRPAALRRCLIAVSQLDYGPFEVVVVADPVSCTSLRGVPQAAYAKLIQYGEANNSIARNLGISAAAGDIVAFIDDLAVPEPTWLKFLIAPFSDADTSAAGGFVRGPNGISWQHRAQSIDQKGQSAPIDVTAEQATIFGPSGDMAIKTPATNMAVRRSVLVDMGGFDPCLGVHLGAADLNLRLAKRGLCTAIVPQAEVHRGSTQRGGQPSQDLFEVGASWAVLLRKHCPLDQRSSAWRRVWISERRRAVSQMISGALEPRDIRRQMRALLDGYGQGTSRQVVDMSIQHIPSEPFQPGPARRSDRSVILSGRFWSRYRLRRTARVESAAGSVVTLILLSPTALFHHVSFARDGYWEQNGGLFGKSIRTQKLMSFWSFHRRVKAERNRVEIVRGLL